MDNRRLNYIFAWGVFLLSAITYLYTMQKTLSFWDCGEFIACAYTISIPHPPGAPLWILLGKVATMFPIGPNPALRMNALAAISSAFTSMFLYLVIVSVIKAWKGEVKDKWDSVMIFCASAIGALSLTFSDAEWFNANESEVYALGTMLAALCVWLLMYWWEKADEKGNERYLMLIAFIVGLSLGIHLLVVQIILVGGVLYYFRKHKYERKTFLIALGVTIAAFVIVYPVTVIWLPTWLGGNIKAFKIENSGAVTFLTVIGIAAIAYGIFWAQKKKKSTAALAFASIFLVILGYTIYTGVILRARVDNLPINENKPSNLEKLVSYLSREQYGDAPFWPRQYSQEPMHKRTWANYSGNMDFMWKYQINQMFNRYLGWQYIGRESYDQDTGIGWTASSGTKMLIIIALSALLLASMYFYSSQKYLNSLISVILLLVVGAIGFWSTAFKAIPFLIGLFGLFYHFRKDWKLGLTFLWMFLLMGIFTALFQRQQDPQPRERDYFYTGAFFVYSLWVGLGVMGIIDLVKESIKESKTGKIVSGIVLVLCFTFVPVMLFKTNLYYNNRNGNTVPFEYAYSLLQGLDKDAILFTNGDNDTFPLWYLQAVEGIRTDIRVVNLSLLNTDWYIDEMKNQMPYGSLKVPISLTDDQIKQISPIQWGDFKVVTVNVPPEAYPDSLKQAGKTPDKLSWRMPYTFASGQVKAVKVQDQMIYDIVKTNNWQRPLYFSATVTEDNFIGLDEYMVQEGMGKRIVPFKPEVPAQYRVNTERMWKNFMVTPAGVSKTPQDGYFFNNFSKTGMFFNQVEENIVQSYRSQYLTFAYEYSTQGDKAKTNEVLNRMEANFPKEIVPYDYRILYDICMLYARADNMNKFNELSPIVEKDALDAMKKNPGDIQSYWNPYKLLIDIYETRADYAKAIDILYQLDRMTPNNPEVKQKIEMLKLKQQGK
jgi:MFS family permease